jgi:hypothetical protein
VGVSIAFFNRAIGLHLAASMTAKLHQSERANHPMNVHIAPTLPLSIMANPSASARKLVKSRIMSSPSTAVST